MSENIGKREKLVAIRAAFITNVAMAIVGAVIGTAVPSEQLLYGSIGYGVLSLAALIGLLRYMRLKFDKSN